MVSFFTRRVVAFIVAGFAFLCLVFTTGCKKQEEAKKQEDQPRQSIRIGLIPEHNIFRQKNRHEPLADYLSQKTGINIELEVLSRHGDIIENFSSLGLDGAFFGSFTGALAHKRLKIEALARPESIDGISTSQGLIFVRKDSGIETAEDMKGKRFAFVDKATTAGWLLPLHYFQKEGVENYSVWFSEIYFTGTHEDAILDVLNKRADVGAAKNTVFERLAGPDSKVLKELLILTRSAPMPANALAVRSNLDSLMKKKLKEALLYMDQDAEGRRVLEKFGAARFIETTEEDYMPVFIFAEHLGLDLTTYDYIND